MFSRCSYSLMQGSMAVGDEKQRYEALKARLRALCPDLELDPEEEDAAFIERLCALARTAPGRSFLAEAQRAGAQTIEFARELTPISPEFVACIYGPLVETVPDWVKRAIAGD